MQANDYMRLAKISLDSRKKNTRSTVRGIAFGLIFIIPVLYLALGIYVELTSKINAVPELLGVHIVAGDERSGFEPIMGMYRLNNVPSTSNLDDVIDAAEGEKYCYEQLITKRSYSKIAASGSQDVSGSAFSFGIGGAGNEYFYETYSSYNYGEDNFAAILDLGRTTGMKDGLLHSEKLERRYGGMYVDGMSKGFDGNGKGQVIVSELFLNVLGYSARDVYGKKITLSYTDSVDENHSGYSSVYIDGDGDPANNEGESANGLAANTRDIKLFNEYEVVGVIKSEITRAALRARDNYSASYIMQFMQNAVFLTDASRDIGGGRALEPHLTRIEDGEYDWFIATYADDYDTYNDEYLGLGANNFTSVQRFGHTDEDYNYEYYATPTTVLLVDAKDYAQLDRIVGQVSGALIPIYPEGSRDAVIYKHASDTYGTFSMMYFMFSYIILLLGVFGGVVFFSAMVNLFNSIAHSVDTRKHYLGVMRAIGAPGGMIAKLYMAESLTIFRRAVIWIAIFASGICVALWLSINATFKYLNEQLAAMFSVELSISIAYAPLVIIASLAVLVLVGGLFSYFLSRSVANKPITSILTD